MHYYFEALKKYAVFSGRSRRKEYWIFSLFNIIISIVLGFTEAALGMSGEMGMGIISIIYALFVFLPGLAVTVRRLHDTNRSGWWIFISLIPLIGAIVLLVFMVTDSNEGDNNFGSDPKA